MIQPKHPGIPKRKRTVYAPPPVGEGAVNRIDSVILAEDEDVEWQWTHDPDGTHFVSGYTIIRIAPEPEPPPD
jgi:hypothetical protein